MLQKDRLKERWLGIVIGVVLWLYVVGILIFLGAEIVLALQQRRGIEGENRADRGYVSEGDTVSLPGTRSRGEE